MKSYADIFDLIAKKIYFKFETPNRGNFERFTSFQNLMLM